MDATRWTRIQSLFHRAADLPAAEQHALLAEEERGDPSLVAEVRALLAEDAAGGSLLDRGLAHVAHGVLDRATLITLPFTELGPYRVTSVLGEGGMGIVYLAERDDLASHVAVKVLRDAWLSPARRERFAIEQRTLAQLNHPSIARLYDAGVLMDGTPWFAMEYVEGEPLTTYCRSHGCTVDERLRLLRDVCEAVQHAHGHAVIHRDLKPSNILVRRDGAVRLLDFGIAKQLDALDPGAEQTRTGVQLMTPAYAAPEQLRAGRIGARTDVYALGVILYELLAGQLPFDLSNRTPSEAERVIVEEQAERPSVVARRQASSRNVSDVSDAAWSDLDVLCLTAMHKDPERRYRSVDALIRDIDNYLNGEPLEARPDSLRYRTGKFVRRNSRAVATTAIAIVLLVTIGVFYAVRLAAASNAAVAQAARAARIQHFMLNLFDGGESEVGPADSLRVLTLVDRGVREARQLDREPAVQAELFETLGGVYQKLGLLPRADTLFRAALARRESMFGRDAPESVESLVSLGLLRIDQAQFDSAERLIRDGLARGSRTLAPGHPSMLLGAVALGRVLTERGAFDSAARVLTDASRREASRDTASSELAQTLAALASAHYLAGRYELSDSLNRRVLAMHRGLYGEGHPRVAEVLLSLAATRITRGEYAEAEQYDRRAMSIIEPWYGPDHPRTAEGLTQLGQSLVYQKKYDEAVPVLRRALGIRERLYGPMHPSVASTLNELGNIAYMRDQYDEAEASYSRMASIYRAAFGEHHHLVGIALSNLGAVYTDRKEYARAERIFRQTTALFTETEGAGHVDTGISRINLARTLIRQRRFAESVTESFAGYEIMMKQASPAVSYVRAARRYLAAAYDSLGQPEKSARFRRELTADSLKYLKR